MNKLEGYFKKEGFLIEREQAEKFLQYMDLLLDWNKKINLTAIVDEKEIIFKHFIDSLLLMKVKDLPLTGKSFIDVGTGAGLPGLPLAIYSPESKVTLSDSLRKRTDFLNIVKEELAMDNVKVLNGRAEDLAKDPAYREQYDFALARAVSKMPVLLEYCLPFVKLGGYFIAYKGPDYLTELDESKRALKELGGEIVAIESLSIDEMNLERNLILVKKIKKTPDKYPRQAGRPSKKPL